MLVSHERQAGDDRRPLWSRNKEEGQVISIGEDPVSGANHGLGIGSEGKSHSGLKVLVITVDKEPQAGFEIVAQAVVQGKLPGELPLVLREESIVAVVEIDVEIRCLRRQEGVLPSGRYGGRCLIGIKRARSNG